MGAAVAKPVLAWLAEWLAAGPLFLRIAARRPASWLAAALASAAVWAVEPVEAMAVAALATLAAVGHLPAPGLPRSLGGWLAARLVWPVLGVATGGAVRLVGADSAPAATIVAAAGTALLLTAITLWAVRRAGAAPASGVTAADAMSLAMVTSAAAVMIGSAADSWLLATASWAALAVVGPCLVRWLHDAADAPLPRSASDMVAGPLSRTPIRRFLGRTAMVTMLLAMVGWLLLDPAQSDWAAVLAAVWMIGLTAPLALLQAGSADGRGSPWGALWRSAAGQRPGGSLLRGGPPMAVDTVARHAAVLGWPSLVAAAVALGSPAGPWPALVVAVVILTTAGGILLVGLLCEKLSLSGETALATVLAVVAGALVFLPMALRSDIAAFRLNLPNCGW